MTLNGLLAGFMSENKALESISTRWQQTPARTFLWCINLQYKERRREILARRVAENIEIVRGENLILMLCTFHSKKVMRNLSPKRFF